MPKSNLNHLPKLIQNMNGNEKRFFQKQKSKGVKKGKGDLYYELYESILRQGNSYNEEELKSVVPAGRFSYLKNYLYNQLLDSLFSYHSENTPDLFVLKQLSLARILFKKNLYDQCKKVLHKAEKEAEKREMFLELLDIMRWKLNVIKKQGFTSKGVRESKKILKKNRHILKLHNNLQKYRDLHFQMHTLSSTLGRLGSNKQLRECHELAQNPLLQNKEKALSDTARYFYHITNAVYLRLTGKSQEAFDMERQNLKLFKSNPQLIYIHPDAYIATINNCIVSNILLKDYRQAEENLNTLSDSRHIKEILKYSEFSKNNLFLYTTVHRLDVYIHTGRFEKGIELIKRSEKSIRKYIREVNSPNIFLIYYNAACIFFGNGDYRESLKWLNKIEINSLKGVMLHVYSYERILSLIIHYELGNYHLVEYRWKSVMNFLESKNYKHKAAYITIKTLKILSEKNVELREKEKKEVFKKLYEELEKLSRDKKQAQAFDYFDYLTWAKSKFSGKSFKELTREKFVEEQA